MSRNVLIVVAVVVIIAIAALGFALFRTPEEASAPIEAIPLTIETAEPAAATGGQSNVETGPAATPATADVAAEPVSTPTMAAEPAPDVEPAATAEPAPETGAATDAGPAIFEIVQAESEARFIIDEVLRGSPKTVIGVTDQVAGQIAVDPANPGSAQVGVIQVNARTLATDSDFRNRAIKNQILRTDSYEFVTFEPAEILGLPGSVTVGEPFSFQITGDLTIRDTTLPVTFDVTVTPASETRLEGLASTNFLYADFGLVIPDAQAVNSVEDDVTLELAFVAVAQ